MKTNTEKKYSTITIGILIITQIIVRSIGEENIPTMVFISLMIIGFSLFIYAIRKKGEKGFGTKCNMIVAILMIIMIVSMGVTMIVYREYPNLKNKYGDFLLIISLASYFAFGIFIIIWGIIYRRKHN